MIFPARRVLNICVAMCLSGMLANAVPAKAQGVYVSTYVERDITPLWFADDFASLEKFVAPLRSPAMRTPSGGWMLAEFYRTFHANFLSENSVIDYPDGFAWTKLNQYSKAFPDSPTPPILRAIAMANLARLSSRAHIITSLPEAGWQPHFAYARDARETLASQPSLGDQDPHYFVPLIRLMVFTGGEVQDLLLMHAEASARWPQYDEIHVETMELLAYLTKHNERSLRGLANTVHAASMSRDGEQTYARLIDGMSQRKHGHEIMSTIPVQWERLRAGLSQIAAAYPTEENKQRLALYACLAGDRNTATVAFQSTADKAVRTIWRKPQTYRSCRDWSIK